MTEEISFQKEVAELMIDLSLFVDRINPNPLVAIAGIEIFKNNIINQYFLCNKIEDSLVKITNREVRDLYDQLWEFFKELDIYDHPEAAITVLEFTKYQFMKAAENLGRKR